MNADAQSGDVVLPAQEERSGLAVGVEEVDGVRPALDAEAVRLDVAIDLELLLGGVDSDAHVAVIGDGDAPGRERERGGRHLLTRRQLGAVDDDLEPELVAVEGADVEREVGGEQALVEFDRAREADDRAALLKFLSSI